MMYLLFLLIVAGLAAGLLIWLIERRRTPKTAIRLAIIASISYMIILGMGFVGEGMVPVHWHRAGLAGGLLLGFFLTVVLQKTFGGKRPVG